MLNYNYPLRKLRNQHYLPLGGIGTGCVGLSESGEIIDFDISAIQGTKNNGKAFFSIRAENIKGEVCERTLLSGVSAGFPEAELLTSFPCGEMSFTDKEFPANVKLTAYNPFIPFNDVDSGIPAAMLEYRIENTSDTVLTFTVKGVLKSPFKVSSSDFCNTRSPHIKCARVIDSEWDTDIVLRPQMCLGVFGNCIEYEELSSPHGNSVEVTISEKIKVLPGMSEKVRFVISWYIPYRRNIWDIDDNIPVKNYYTRYFDSAVDCVRYCFAQWDSLYEKTNLARELIFTSTLPYEALEAISSGLCVLKLPNCQRYSDGYFTGYESCSDGDFASAANDSALWSKVYTLAYLFPALERAIITDHFLYDISSNGALAAESHFPNGADEEECKPRPVSQFCDILRVYRLFKLTGNVDFLSDIQKGLISSLEYAQSPKNPAGWDKSCKGIISYSQGEELTDISIGETAYYLAAMKIGAELCAILKDKKRTSKFREIYENGAQSLNNILQREDCRINASAAIDVLTVIWHCKTTGLGDVINNDVAKKLLISACSQWRDEAIVKDCGYILATLLLYFGMSSNAIDVIREINSNRLSYKCGYDTILMSSYALMNGFCGMLIDKFGKYFRFCPDMSFSEKNVFRCFVCFDGFMGFIERGIDYVQLNCVKGSVLIRKVEAPDLPLKVKSGGIEIGFVRDGNCAILDNDCEICPDKDLFVIFSI